MNDTNMIDSCHAHLPVQNASNARSDTGVVIDSDPHLSRTSKTRFLFAPLAVHVHAGCSACPLKPLIRFKIKYKTILSSIY